MNSAARRRRLGFTLIEVLIVVVIMAVLAATIIPQFSSSTLDAKEGTLRFNLHSMRGQIELYRMQHNGKLPTSAIVEQLTKKTNKDGEVGSGTAHVLGPYIFDAIPANPVNGKNTIKVVTGTDAITAGDDEFGYIYNSDTGELRSAKTGNDSSGTSYLSY